MNSEEDVKTYALEMFCGNSVDNSMLDPLVRVVSAYLSAKCFSIKSAPYIGNGNESFVLLIFDTTVVIDPHELRSQIVDFLQQKDYSPSKIGQISSYDGLYDDPTTKKNGRPS